MAAGGVAIEARAASLDGGDAIVGDEAVGVRGEKVAQGFKIE